MVGIDLSPLRGEHDEADVMMKMGVLSRRIDPVNVEIDRLGPHSQATDAGLFARFAQSDGGEVGVTIGMSTGLHPDLQLGVEEHKGAFTVGVNDEGRPGEMPGPFGASQWLRPGVEQLVHPAAHVGK